MLAAGARCSSGGREHARHTQPARLTAAAALPARLRRRRPRPRARCIGSPPAISPGLVKEQESYILGSVADPALARALLGLFMDPDASIDPPFTAAAGSTLLAFANGHRTGSARTHGASDVAAASLQLAKHGRWGLPDVGKPPQQVPLVKGVRRAVVYQQVRIRPQRQQAGAICARCLLLL